MIHAKSVHCHVRTKTVTNRLQNTHMRLTWLPEHSEAMSVMDSLCSSRTSDKVILLPLLGTSNTKIAPDETPIE